MGRRTSGKGRKKRLTEEEKQLADKAECDALLRALREAEATHGAIGLTRRAAEILNVSIDTLWYLIDKHAGTQFKKLK